MADFRFSIREDCRICGSRRLDCVLPLEPLPLVSPNVGVSEATAIAAANVTVPTDLYLCADCGLLQLTAVIDPAFQYNKFKYVTTISRGLPEHFRQSADQIVALAGLPACGKVIEVGSNDGTLLKVFQERGWEVVGIDPAEKAAQLANEQGVPTIIGFFNSASAQKIAQQNGPANLVIANNTLANIDNLDEVAAGLDVVLATDGVFVFETSYGAEVVRKCLLDTIYHEHLSYFMVRPLQTYFARHGLELFHVDKIATKGGSIRGFARRAGGSRRRSSVDALIAEEEKDGLFGQKIYGEMRRSLRTIKDNLGRVFDTAGGRGRKVAAYGASVGCVTLINQLNLADKLDCIFDDHPLLEAVIGPGFSIPVVESSEIYQRKPDVIVVLAWRYAQAIIQKHEKFQRQGGEFLLPLPVAT